MTRVMELRQDRAEKINRMREILDKCDDEKRQMNTQESQEYRKLDKEVDGLNERIQAEDRLAGLESNQSQIVNPFRGIGIGTGGRSENETRGGFENLAEMLCSIYELKKSGRQDERLTACLETREQMMGSGTGGGFAIPTQFREELMAVPAQGAIVRPRAMVIPAGSPPDATLEFPLLDQTSGQNMFGGVTITHGGEGVTLTETSAALRQGSLTPKQMNAYIVCTNKLLRNWASGGTIISTLLRNAVAAAEDYDFLRGDGINKALGIINNPASIVYPRAGANAVAFSDVYGMLARVKMGGSLVWIASQTIIPQLASMVDAGSHAVWTGSQGVGNAAQAMPSTLLGTLCSSLTGCLLLGAKVTLCLLTSPTI